MGMREGGGGMVSSPGSGRIVDLPAKKWSDPARIMLVHGVTLKSFLTWLGGAAGVASREITNALSALRSPGGFRREIGGSVAS